MKLTKFEKEICARHHSDEEGIIHCDNCPLVIDAFNCKATVTRKEKIHERTGEGKQTTYKRDT